MKIGPGFQPLYSFVADVHLPTSDGRALVLPRHTQPDDHGLLLHQLGLRLPEQMEVEWRSKATTFC